MLRCSISITSLVCLFIVAIVYSKGVIAGSATCATFCIICALAMAEPEIAEDGVFVNAVANNPRSFIANRSQTKWIGKPSGPALDEGIFGILDKGTSYLSDDEMLFIPIEELVIIDGWKRMKTTREAPRSDDYYILNKKFHPTNVASEFGGGGVPTWFYHPSGPIYVFGFFGLPALGLGAVIKSKL